MKQQFLTARIGLAALTAFLAAPAASTPDAAIVLITSDAGGTVYDSSYDLYDTLFASTTGGFAVGSTSPNFGGSTMATASSTGYLHLADARLYQLFTLPSFITSAEITIDFKGQAFAIGNAVAWIDYSIDLIVSGGARINLEYDYAYSTDLTVLGGQAGSVDLSARSIFTLFGGETVEVTTRSAAETGYTEGTTSSTYYAGPGYATAFMDPVIRVSAAVPEPATWALLIAGFGLVGGAARHRRPTHA